MESVIKSWEEETGKVQIGTVAEVATDEVVDLQMAMTNSSLTHEYLRQELDKTSSFYRRQQLLAQMDRLKRTYYQARESLLSLYRPEEVSALEQDLAEQKQVVFVEYHA